MPALEMIGITKRFGALVANRNVHFRVERGTIHALVGENGAGKSTLMNVLYGLYEPDEGEIRIGGNRVERLSPARAVELGLGMVHQHFMLIPTFTVLENIVLGIEETRGGMLDLDSPRKRLLELVGTYHLEVDPDALAGELSVGMRQRVEILKVLMRGAEVLLLDEPTAVLTPQEVEELFKIVRLLKSQGKTIVFISHKLREVKAISDRLTVMRGGEVVATDETASVSESDIAERMVGRRVLLDVKKQPARPGDVCLEVRDLCLIGGGAKMVLDHVDLQVRAGEILGLAGVVGNGQTELVHVLAGFLSPSQGSVWLDGRDLLGMSVLERYAAGLAHIPEDRHRHGMVVDLTARDNAVLGKQRAEPFSHWGVLDEDAIRQEARARITQFDVRPPRPEVRAGDMSGGNQQKLVISREVAREPRFLIAAMPTRGVDIGAIEFIHRHLIELRDRGVAILVVSAELSEVLGLADRIAVMYEGRVMDVMDAASATEQRLGLLMAGVRSQPEAIAP
ncbi:MAG: ABC transporter ATP-binding protein [Candidatus Wallbacteria bacterium]|nr:ABC transporter ATP-binding protein [Candidatus Wallbacteria bacterium]